MNFQMMIRIPTARQKPRGHIMNPPATQISSSFNS